MPTMDAYAPFDSGAGANVTESTWRRFMRRMRADMPSHRSGVIYDALNIMEVYADDTGMQVKVKTGEVWIEGHWGEVSTEKTVSIAAADAAFARNDRIVAAVDFVNNTMDVYALTGTPAASPTTPAVTQDGAKWEISLAVVNIPTNDTSIGAAQVTDDRRYLSLPFTSVSSTQNASGTTTSSGSWTSTLGGGGTACSFTFVASSTGRVLITNTCAISNNGGSFSYCGIRVRTGAVVGSGTDVVADDTNNAIRNNTSSSLVFSRSRLVSGLTPNATYNVQQRFIVDGSTGSFESKHLTVTPA